MVCREPANQVFERTQRCQRNKPSGLDFFLRATNRSTEPTKTAIPPLARVIFGSMVTEGSPAIGSEAVGVGCGVGSGRRVGLGSGIESVNVRS
jgi:hypothetical protein